MRPPTVMVTAMEITDMRFITLSLVFLLGAAPAYAEDTHAAHHDQWYEGGTLQKADITEWQKATPENQLATSADFIASLSGLSEIAVIKDPKELEAIKTRSTELQTCINEAISAEELAADKPVAHLVITCTILKR